MGTSTEYAVPDRVYKAVDQMTIRQRWDLIWWLQIPEHDAPEDDHADWTKQRILDYLYDSNWKAPK